MFICSRTDVFLFFNSQRKIRNSTCGTMVKSGTQYRKYLPLGERMTGVTELQTAHPNRNKPIEMIRSILSLYNFRHPSWLNVRRAAVVMYLVTYAVYFVGVGRDRRSLQINPSFAILQNTICYTQMLDNCYKG